RSSATSWAASTRTAMRRCTKRWCAWRSPFRSAIRWSTDRATSVRLMATAPFRPNYDGTKTEPVVLPARIPNLLVNGAAGIAVGMATNIPPHHLGEICTALVKMIDADLELSSAQLCKYIKGPDFPTGGQILNTPAELKEIYETGSGSIRMRATWQ